MTGWAKGQTNRMETMVLTNKFNGTIISLLKEGVIVSNFIHITNSNKTISVKTLTISSNIQGLHDM